MKFDIARKVVKFQNGQYGIRRWTVFGYEFLDIAYPSLGDTWWSYARHVAEYAVGTEKQVRARLELYLQPNPAAPGYDKGRPA